MRWLRISDWSRCATPASAGWRCRRGGVSTSLPICFWTLILCCWTSPPRAWTYSTRSFWSSTCDNGPHEVELSSWRSTRPRTRSSRCSLEWPSSLPAGWCTAEGGAKCSRISHSSNSLARLTRTRLITIVSFITPNTIPYAWTYDKLLFISGPGDARWSDRRGSARIQPKSWTFGRDVPSASRAAVWSWAARTFAPAQQARQFPPENCSSLDVSFLLLVRHVP